MQRFFLTDHELEVGTTGLFPQDVIHQILHVLRMKSGDEVMLLDNSGNEYASVIEVNGKRVTYEVVGCTQNTSEPPLYVISHQAFLKQHDRFELAVQKATELGASEITPLITDRCQVRELRKPERLEKIIRESAEQCERGKLPRLNDTTSFETLCNVARESDDVFLFFYEGLDADQIALPVFQHNVKIHAIIGPEGGFSEEEGKMIERMCDEFSHCHALSLGPRILRAETASIVALARILI